MIKFASERVALELPAGSLSKDLCFALLMSFLSNLKKLPLFYCQIYKLNNFATMQAVPGWIGLWLAGCVRAHHYSTKKRR